MSFSPLDPLPVAPQRSDSNEVFIQRADDFVAAMTVFSGQLNTFIDELELAAALIDAAPAYTDPGLLALGGNTPAADLLPYYTGSNTSGLATLTAAGRALLDDANAAAQRTTLGIDIGYMVPAGGIIMWSGSIASIPAGWVLCDGANGTPDLRDRFVVGAGSTYAVADNGGAATHSHTITVDSATTGVTRSTTTATVNGDSDLPTCLTSVTLNDPGHSHTASSNSQSNLPPYYALAYIMKT